MSLSLTNMERARDLGRRLVDWWKIYFSVLLLLLALFSGLFYYQTTQWRHAYDILQEDYIFLRQEHISLQNDTSTLEAYYNDIQDRYSLLKNEYADLQNLYLTLQRDMMELQNEFDGILDLKKEVILEKDKVLEILPEENLILFYELDLGYIDVNFTSSAEIYFWIGSSLTEEKYYSRYPPFPKTVYDGAFTVPVCDDVYLNIYNPNPETISKITLTITLTY